jgi:hypothetical protein
MEIARLRRRAVHSYATDALSVSDGKLARTRGERRVERAFMRERPLGGVGPRYGMG